MEHNETLINLLAESFPMLYERPLLEEIAKESALRKVSAGDQIIGQGTFFSEFPMVIDGVVKVFRENDEGKEVYLYSICKGEVCAMALTCCIANMRSSVLATAEEDVTLISIPIRFLDLWTSKYPSWKAFVFISYRHRFDELIDTVDSIAFQKLDERLTQYLCRIAKERNSTEIIITHQTIAKDLNSSREVISRLLKQMQSKGWLALGRNKINIFSLCD